MSTTQIIKELKQNNEDFEWYPTTNEMLDVIYPYLNSDTVLDIGCGNCKFKNYIQEKQSKLNNESKISTYYVIEKAKTFLNNLDEQTLCLGTDFYASTLIDKKVDTIFCNPPYSDFENWVVKIITEGNFKQAFLIIPERWQNSSQIKSLLKAYRIKDEVIGTFDFNNAERQARATVNIVRLIKEKYINYHGIFDKTNKQEDFDMDSFDTFFNETFGINKTYEENRKERRKTEYEIKEEQRVKNDERIKNALTNATESKATTLVHLYNEDYEKLINNLKAIMQLDEDVMKTFNISVTMIKKVLIEKMQGLKILYWDKVFNELDEITDRLTFNSREKLKEKFTSLNCIDFTIENIWMILIWVIKNANKYYESQLVDFYKKLSDEETNVKPYKSNQKLFEKDGWRWSCKNKTHYVLDYRIIMSSPFRQGWNGELEEDYYGRNDMQTLKDIKVIANNLGFFISDFVIPCDFGDKEVTTFINSDKIFMEYRVYKNKNIHIKFNQEFTKALNVEVSRILGWIRSKEDISKEFPKELSNGAEKYFKSNYTFLPNNNLKFLTCNSK